MILGIYVFRNNEVIFILDYLTIIIYAKIFIIDIFISFIVKNSKERDMLLNNLSSETKTDCEITQCLGSVMSKNAYSYC